MLLFAISDEDCRHLGFDFGSPAAGATFGLPGALAEPAGRIVDEDAGVGL
ncbi:hypothetical protein AB0368_01555 [Actinoplanes sp. NPDC051475]